ncbi:MAG: alpha/beta hydrolase [Gillisia sp.]
MIQNLTLNNGITIEYSDHGEGETLLLLHGLGSTKADWNDQITAFAENYRVIAPDFRGHGNSTKPTSKKEYGVGLCAEDMKLLLQELKINQCMILGFSMGGAVAFEMAVKYPSLLSKMVIVNTAPDFNKLGWLGNKMVLERTLSLKFSGMEPLAKKVARGMFPEENQKELRESFYKRAIANDVNAYYHSFRSLMRWGIGDEIRNIKIPVLVIASDMDYTPVSLKESYAKKMLNAKVAVIKNSRHGVTMDQPEDFNRTVLKFIDS